MTQQLGQSCDPTMWLYHMSPPRHMTSHPAPSCVCCVLDVILVYLWIRSEIKRYTGQNVLKFSLQIDVLISLQCFPTPGPSLWTQRVRSSSGMRIGALDIRWHSWIHGEDGGILSVGWTLLGSWDIHGLQILWRGAGA